MLDPRMSYKVGFNAYVIYLINAQHAFHVRVILRVKYCSMCNGCLLNEWIKDQARETTPRSWIEFGSIRISLTCELLGFCVDVIRKCFDKCFMKWCCLFVWFWIWCALQIPWMLWLLVPYGFPKNDIIDLWWFRNVMNYKRLPNACLTFEYMTWRMFYMKTWFLACIGGRSLCGLGGNAHIYDHDHGTYGRLW